MSLQDTEDGMTPERLREQARLIVTIMENLNGIKSLKEEYGINDAVTLAKDRTVQDSMCYGAVKVYTTYALCTAFHDRKRFSNHRASLVHLKMDKPPFVKGFDLIEPEELWNDHFNGALLDIEKEVIDKLSLIPDLREFVDELTRSAFGEPEQAEVLDLTHREVIKEIQDKWAEVSVCSVALLHLMSRGTTPPLFEKLISYIEALVGGTREEIEHAIQLLIDRNILSRSSSERFLFVEDRAFAMNVTRDFLEHNDPEAILDTIRGLEDDN